jgi:hypothetical protein
MNNYDRNNLNFLLGADKRTFKKWTQTVTWDDMNYAMEILGHYGQELEQQAMELRVEAELDLLDGKYDQAAELIKKVANP